MAVFAFGKLKALWLQRSDDDARSAATVIAGVSLLLLAAHFDLSARAIPDMANPGSGTPWAPHSDALGPWFNGGLAYLFGIHPPPYLYRPTVAIFWSSLLALTERVQAIPVFFVTWLVAIAFAAVGLTRDRALRLALAFVLALAAARFAEGWAAVGLNVDLAALALTFTGVVLVLWDPQDDSRGALYMGCLCLGIAAAIRGPMVLAGPMLIATRVLLIGPRGLGTLAACGAMFVMPFALDVAWQVQVGVSSNGLQALYCVPADPGHRWTRACADRYHELVPSVGEVVSEYLAYATLSAEGRSIVLGRFAWRLVHDLGALRSPATMALLLAISTLASRYVPGTRAHLRPLVRALAIVAALLAASADAAPAAYSIALVPMGALAAAMMRHWRAFGCLAGYLAGTAFLTSLGLQEDRLQFTFEFMLALGVALLVLEPVAESSPQASRPARVPRALAASVACGLLFLYTGGFVLPSPMRDTYLREVYHKPLVAMKVADDSRIDRSLYYTWDQVIVYVRHDELPIGAVRRYRNLASASKGNRTFIAPNAFVD